VVCAASTLAFATAALPLVDIGDVRLRGRGSGTDFNRHGERKQSNDSANVVEIC
jgi:hypothetical protein